jgi:imidazoleglycerol-phosphate dehydratase/histidinol-phosphatase
MINLHSPVSTVAGKKVLFIDRDGTMINEFPPLYQIDTLEKVTFYPGALKYLGKIYEELDYEFVLVSNQDGLGTPKFTEEQFWPAHNLVMNTFAGEGLILKKNWLIVPCRRTERIPENRAPACSALISTTQHTTFPTPM